MQRQDYFTFQNGQKAALPFSDEEYANRLLRLRALMAEQDLEAILFTSMHNIAYFSGFLYCAFGRPYGCVVTQDRCVTVSANIDFGQPWRRSVSENVIYTDWRKDNFFRAVYSLIGGYRRLGVEHDHMNYAMCSKLKDELGNATITTSVSS